MNLLNKWVSFSVIVLLKAIMDYLNFQVEHNTGFFSLTDGWVDAWHLSGWFMFLIIGIHFVWNKSKWQDNMLRLGALGVIALVGQLLFYNFLFKL